MDDDKLDSLTRDVIIDALEGWELVEFLQIPIERIVDFLEDDILENIEDVRDLVNLRNDNNEEDEEDIS